VEKGKISIVGEKVQVGVFNFSFSSISLNTERKKGIESNLSIVKEGEKQGKEGSKILIHSPIENKGPDFTGQGMEKGKEGKTTILPPSLEKEVRLSSKDLKA